MNEVSTLLVALSRLDAEITQIQSKEKALIAERQKADGEIRELQQGLTQASTQHAAALERQSAEEAKLRDEQRKIVERRKQLTALGGSKSARILEREVDVAGRAILQLESRVVSMLEDAEKIEKKRQELQSTLETKSGEQAATSADYEAKLAALREELQAKKTQRDENLVGLPPQAKQSYSRISTRYPGSAVARAESGSCQACFRALPAQIFNTVLSGKELVQCPGCNRILVSGELFNSDPA